eukprot:6195677-Pleurochrysis_carterae.AAC.4
MTKLENALVGSGGSGRTEYPYYTTFGVLGLTYGYRISECVGNTLRWKLPGEQFHFQQSDQQLITRPRPLCLECELLAERAGKGRVGPMGASWWLPLQLPKPHARGSPSRGVPPCHWPAHFERPHATADCVPTRGTLSGVQNTEGRGRARCHRTRCASCDAAARRAQHTDW